MKIILVENNARNALMLVKALKSYNYQVETVDNNNQGMELVKLFNYDLLLLSLTLPAFETINLCRQLRLDGYQTPMMMLAPEDCDYLHTQVLAAGADDFIVKPIELSALTARIQALLRRGRKIVPTILTWESLECHINTKEVSYKEKQLRLTPKEYGLLTIFLQNPRKLFSRSDLINSIWLSCESPGEEAVTTQIKGLRQKLKAAGMTVDLIETVYGLGYRLKEEYTANENSQDSREVEPVGSCRDRT
ncbi:MAG: response regulator transcription factor [Scytonema sp. PMC 1069.18]|nr:response regulator transcription factor [Scytonema sp. PMC 1069.18]MEC4883051.1 response regulator transcription factor [Scytonema sp. PMC 1070.18]